MNRPDSFRCRNGQCIDAESLCDGRAHCSDSSDETEYECKKPEILCPTYAFRCDYGACINGDYRCNGIRNCVDNSDEAPSLCNRNNRPNDQTERSTDANVPARKCKEDEYRCANGQQCIHITSVCDGTANCADGSDETSTICGTLP